MRRQILISYIHYDLLEIENNFQQGTKSVFDLLYTSESMKVREYLIAFLNSLASEYQGRTYLLAYKGIVEMLVETLYEEGNNDSYLRQNALGALQKFSLRK